MPPRNRFGDEEFTQRHQAFQDALNTRLREAQLRAEKLRQIVDNRNWRQIQSRLDPLLEEQKKQYLDLLEEHGKHAFACRELGISQKSVEKSWAADETFKEACNEALKRRSAHIARVIEIQALDGHLEEEWQGGELVRRRVKLESNIRAMMLKAHDPEKYGETSTAEDLGLGVLFAPADAPLEEWEATVARQRQLPESVPIETVGVTVDDGAHVHAPAE
jgi:hypothetical protein